MTLITDNMRWIMLVSGLLTLTMAHAVVAPRAAMRAMFGESLDSMSADIVVRNWAALIVGGGAMLIYSAFHAEWRPLVLLFVGAGKLVFIALVLSRGRRYLKRQAGIAVALDSLMVALFAVYLVAAWAR